MGRGRAAVRRLGRPPTPGSRGPTGLLSALVALADFQAPQSATGLNRHGVPGNRWLIWSRVIVVVVILRGRRHADLGNVEPVVEFLSKFTPLHCFFQVAIGGSDHARVYVDHPTRPQTPEP